MDRYLIPKKPKPRTLDELEEGARRAGHLPLGTFDRVLGKLEGVESL